MNTHQTLVVGYGNMGAKHARAIVELGGRDALWGVVEPNVDRLKLAMAAYREPTPLRVFPSTEAAFAGYRKPDCVIVATPPAYHYEPCAHAIANRRPVLVEKPIAGNLEDAASIIEQAQHHRVPIMVGHVERFNPAALAVQKLVQEGAIGKVIQLCFKRVGGAPRDMAGQNVITDLAVHDFDLARFILADTLSISEALGYYEGEHLAGALMLAYAQNIAASLTFQTNWRTPVKIRRIEATGTAGYVEADLIAQTVTLYQKNRFFTEAGSKDSQFYMDYLQTFSAPEKVELAIPKKEPLKEELAAFWQLVESGDLSRNPVPAEDAYMALRLAIETEDYLRVGGAKEITA